MQDDSRPTSCVPLSSEVHLKRNTSKLIPVIGPRRTC